MAVHYNVVNICCGFSVYSLFKLLAKKHHKITEKLKTTPTTQNTDDVFRDQVYTDTLIYGTLSSLVGTCPELVHLTYTLAAAVVSIIRTLH